MDTYMLDVASKLDSLINVYRRLDRVIMFSSEKELLTSFDSQEDLILVLNECRKVAVEALMLHTYIEEGCIWDIKFAKLRDLYKISQIHVTKSIVYHDLKNVFEILDIAASSKSDTLTLRNISKTDIENIYVATVSFVLQTMNMFKIKFNVGGEKRRGRPRKESVG